MGTLLCIGVLPYDVAPLITIAQGARDALGLDAVFLSTARPHVQAEVAEQVVHAGFRSIDRPLMAPEDMSLRNPVRRARRQLRATHRLMDELLEDVQPDAILSSVNCQPGLFLDEAARRGIPTVLLQLFHWGDRAFYAQWQADERRHEEARLGRRGRLRRRVKDRVKAYHGLGTAIAWDVAEATIAVQGPALERRLIEEGVPRTHIAVTGNPMLDDLHRLRHSPDDAARRVRADLGLTPDDVVITHLRSNESRLVALPPVTSRQIQVEIVGALRAADPEAKIVVKLHPRESDAVKEHAASIDDSVVVVDDEVPTNELIATSDVVVSTASTTLLHSVLLDRPTVSAWLWPGLEYFRRITEWSAVERVYDPDALSDAVRRHLGDDDHRRTWRARRDAFVRDEFVFDGQGTARVIELFGTRMGLPPRDSTALHSTGGAPQ